MTEAGEAASYPDRVAHRGTNVRPARIATATIVLVRMLATPCGLRKF
jgi:hypothetical protein